MKSEVNSHHKFLLALCQRVTSPKKEKEKEK